jgi:hypothetical protein
MHRILVETNLADGGGARHKWNQWSDVKAFAFRLWPGPLDTKHFAVWAHMHGHGAHSSST